MSLSEAFAAVVRALRQKSGMSQDDLPLIDRSYLSRVERGKGNVSIEMLLKISNIVLKIPIFTFTTESTGRQL